MEDPSSHGSFGASMRWKTAKRLAPTGVDTGGFDK